MAEPIEFDVDSIHPFKSPFELPENRLDVCGLGTLHWAARRGDEDAVKQLIRSGAIVDRQDHDGLLPLHWAVTGSHDVVARILLENGSPMDTADLSGLMTRHEFVEERTQAMERLVSDAAHSLAKELDLSFCYFATSAVPDTMASMIALKQLDLAYNNLAYLPKEFLKLPNLEQLDVSFNLLTSLPADLSTLSKLTHVNFSHNFVVSLDPVLELQKIVVLDGSHNELEVVPNRLGFLDSLVTLNLSHNFIEKLPRSLSELATLHSLDVSHNRIADVFELTFHRMPCLEVLDVSHNALVEMMWMNIMQTPSLSDVRYWNNNWSPALQRILDCFYSKSPSLDLADLSLTDIPPELQILAPQLTSLSLRNNRFKQLPADLQLLTKLESLDLSYNRLTDLPLFLHKLTNLTKLDIEETRNYLTSPPRSVIDHQKRLKSIRDYWDDLLSGDPCYRMKLMLVGQENVGKSTLLHCLMQYRLKRKSKRGNISTDGIDIANWSFKTNSKQVITFSAWDFAGQEIYYTTHSFFISSKAIYVLVWDLRYADDHSRVDFWLNSVASRASNAPVVLVGTHLDDPMFENNLELVQERLEALDANFGRRFSNIKGITAVSATTGNGSDGLMDILKDIAMDMPNLKETLPKIYVRLEEVIQAKVKDKAVKPPAIQWDEFLQLAEEVQFKDEEQLLRATQFLSDLGSLVFFEDEKTGERLIVLDPQWLTGMFASVITTKHKMVKNGLLLHKHLGQIWRAPLYPEELHRQLIALLQQFEIMFELPQEDDDPDGEKKCYLLPSLLSEERPDFDLLWPALDHSVVQHARIYTLEFVPHGLFSRLMIRLLHFTDRPLKYWRNGVLAVKGPTKALVTIRDKVIHAYTRGDGAAELLRVVIEIVDSLVNQWFQVRLEAVTIPCPHCIALGVPEEEVFQFALDLCEETAAAHQSRFMTCGKSEAQVRLDRLVPDIAMTDFEGSQLNFSELEIGRQLGKGSFGVIYLGRWNGETVAVKRLKVDEDMALAAFAEFRREVWLMSGLTHPCIVNLKGYSVNPLTMVMECVPGGDLFGFLHNEKIDVDWQIRLKIALDIAFGMAFLHGISPPLLHRDLKSPNVLIADHSDGSPVIAKVADFGLSSRLFVDQLQGRPVENPTWCAPEIMQHNPYTEKADVYSYGVMLWEILTRKLPFASYTFQHQVEDDVVRGIRPDIPDDCLPEYAKLIEESWDANPAKRPDFIDIVDRLAALIRSEFGEDDFRFPMFPDARMIERKKKEQTANNVVIGGSLMKQLEENGLPGPVTALAHALSQVWCGCEDGSVCVLSAESGRLLRLYDQAHGSAVTAMLSVFGQVWSVDANGELIVWKVEELTNESAADIVLKEGVLSKQGGEKKLFKSWQTRHFRLYKSGELHYYRSAQDEEAAGIVPLKGVVVEATKKNHRFELRGGGRTYQLQAKSDEEMGEWIEELRRAIMTVSGTPASQLKKVPLNDSRGNASVTSLVDLGDSILVTSLHSALLVLDQTANIIRTIKVITPPGSTIPRDKIAVTCAGETLSHLWLGVGSTLLRLNPSTYGAVDEITGHKGAVRTLVCVNKQMWCGDDNGDIVVYESKSGRVVKQLRQKDSAVKVLSMRQVGKSVWTGGSDGSICQWDVSTFECNRLQQHRQEVTCLEVVYDRLVWSGSHDGTICVWK